MLMNPFKTFTLLTLLVYCTTGSFYYDGLTSEEILNNSLSIKRRQAPSLTCYHCDDCNKVSIDTPTIECPSVGHCYEALGSHDDDFELAATRGCIKEGKYSCSIIQKVYQNKYSNKTRTAVFTKCRTCTSSGAIPCNGAPFEIYGTSPVICYKCEYCDHVIGNTTNIICPEDRCCFRAALANIRNQKYYSVRGCWRLKKDQTCEDTCKYMGQKHRLNYPDGDMHVCIRCDQGDSNNCNYFQFDLLTKAFTEKKVIMCYNCTGCNQVTSTTPNVVCRDSKCCYSVSFLASDASGVTVVRGCAIPPKGQTCDQTCNEIENQHGKGVVQKCIMCETNDFNECNAYSYDTLAIAATPETHLVSCYSCRNCNVVKASTRLLLCDPLCCYRALLKITIDDDWSAIRGCMQVKTGQKCEDTCSLVKKRHSDENRNGTMRVCIQCKKGAFDKCNEPIFSAEDMENTGFGEKLKCYDCMKCHNVEESKPNTVECGDGRCCYSSYLKNKPGEKYTVTRGCGKISQGRPCAETCRDQRNRHMWKHPSGEFINCLPCRTGDKCNNFTYYDDVIQPRSGTNRKSIIACYECSDCYTVSGDTHVTSCRLPECCYVAELKDYYTDNMYVTRGCLHEGDCTETCTDVKNNYLWTHPDGIYLNCTNCLANATNECNGQAFEVPAVQTTLSPYVDYIMCYVCEDCNKITPKTNLDSCMLPGACYIILVREGTNSDKFAVRGFEPGKIDTTTCKNIEDKYLKIHENYTFHYCLTCGDRDNAIGCNKNTYHAKETKKQPTPCYNCRDCNTVESDVLKVNCSQPKCCYMALVRDKLSDKMFAIRGCKESKHCGDTCTRVENDQLSLYSEGTVNFCMFCEKSDNTSVCNGYAYIP